MNQIITILLVAFFYPGTAIAHDRYRIVELSTPTPFTGSAASDINDDGQVAGVVIDAQGTTHAAIWNRTSPPDILPLPPGFTNSFAAAIDERGAVSGSALENGLPVGMSWQLATDLGRPAATVLVPIPLRAFSVVLDIASRPSPYGQFRRRDPSVYAGYRLKKNLQSRAIHMVNNRTHDYGAGVATCVNEGGAVGGYFSKESAKPSNGINASAKLISEPFKAFLRDHNRDKIPLPEEPEQAGIFAMDNATSLVGHAVIRQKNQAARWKFGENNTLQFESLASIASAGDIALAANGLGVVVGRSIDANGRERAVRWMSDGSVVDLNTIIPGNTKWELQEARGINREGYIVGIGQNDGRIRGFVIQPALDACLVTRYNLQDGRMDGRTGDTIVYDLYYSNACNRTLEDVVIREKLPAGAVDLHCLTMKVDEDPITGEVVGYLGTLLPGASGTISFSMRIIAEPGSVITNNLSTIVGRSIMKTSPPKLVTPVTERDSSNRNP